MIKNKTIAKRCEPQQSLTGCEKTDDLLVQQEVNQLLSDHYIYTGKSMNPVFYDADLLEIKPYKSIQSIQCGDVITFPLRKNKNILADELTGEEKKEKNVTHRVVAVKNDLILTRGDNNPNIDPWALTFDQIFGRVTYKIVRQKKYYIQRGFMGRLCMLKNRTRRSLRIIIIRTMKIPYRFLSYCSPIISRIIPIQKKMRVVIFCRNDHSIKQLMLGKKIIATKNRWEAKWRIRRPYRPFINEALLP